MPSMNAEYVSWRSRLTRLFEKFVLWLAWLYQLIIKKIEFHFRVNFLRHCERHSPSQTSALSKYEITAESKRRNLFSNLKYSGQSMWRPSLANRIKLSVIRLRLTDQRIISLLMLCLRLIWPHESIGIRLEFVSMNSQVKARGTCRVQQLYNRFFFLSPQSIRKNTENFRCPPVREHEHYYL